MTRPAMRRVARRIAGISPQKGLQRDLPTDRNWTIPVRATAPRIDHSLAHNGQ